MKARSSLWRKFRADRRGAIAVITAILMFPVIIYCVGMPIDMSRAVQLRSVLQNISDDAALAGAAELKQGGTAYTVCTLANNFVKAQAIGMSVPYSSLTPNSNFATTYGQTLTATTGTNGTTTTTATAAATGCLNISPTVSGSASGSLPYTATFTSPYEVAVSVSSKLPTTFTSFALKNIPVSVSSAAVGPTGLVEICSTETQSNAADLSQLYYYFQSASGTLYQDVKSTSALNPKVGADPANYLADNSGDAPSNYLSPGCGTLVNPTTGVNYPSYLLIVQIPPGWRLAYNYVSTTGGNNPCYYAGTYTSTGAQAAQKASGQTVVAGEDYHNLGPYGYGKTYAQYDNYACITTSTKASSTSPPAQTYTAWNGQNALTTLQTTAYGGTIGTVNRFYSTDYPASLNAKANSTSTTYGTVGDFSASGQSAAINNGSNVIFNSNSGFSTIGVPTQTSTNPEAADGISGQPSGDLVCLATNGAQDKSGFTFTENAITKTNTQEYLTVTGASNDQQQNVVLQNSKQSSLYKCPTNVVGDPYNLNPTCSELNGATITGQWNDMGGMQDSVDYYDLSYSISCTNNIGVSQLEYNNIALIQ